MKVKGKWTEEELKYLFDNYKSMTNKEIAKKLNRSESSVESKLINLSLTKKESKSIPWTNDEVDYLKANYPTKNTQSISEYLGRTVDSITKKAKTLKIKKEIRSINKKNNDSDYNCWTDEEVLYLIENYSVLKTKTVAKFLGRTRNSVVNKANALELKKDYWTDYEIDTLIRNQDKTINELKRLLPNKTGSAIRSKIKNDKLEFKKQVNTNIKRKEVININSKEERRIHHNKMVIIRKYNERGIYIDYDKLYDTYSALEWYLFYEKRQIRKFPDTLTENDFLQIIKYVIENRIMASTKKQAVKIVTDMFRKYRLYSIVHRIGWYNCLIKIYPYYNIKPYEMTQLPDGYLSNKNNAIEFIKHVVANLIKTNNITDIKKELPQYFHYASLRKFGYGRLTDIISKYNVYESFYHCLNEIYPQYAFEVSDFNYFITKNKLYLCNSSEEKICYDFIEDELKIRHIISTYMNKQVKLKYFNEKHNENYVPDFAIFKMAEIYIDKPIIIEYFGLYKENNSSTITKNYILKTHRKVEYYNSNPDIYFIDLYPEDIQNNCEGVRRKLTSFFMSNFNFDIQNVINLQEALLDASFLLPESR